MPSPYHCTCVRRPGQPRPGTCHFCRTVFDRNQEKLRQQEARQAAGLNFGERPAPPVPEIPPSTGVYAAARRAAMPLDRLIHAAGQAMQAGDMATCRTYLATAQDLHGSVAVSRYLDELEPSES